MPPSGFVPVETATFATVAKSLLTRFDAEVVSGVHTSREAGLEHELSTIVAHKSEAPPLEHGVLSFAEGLYLALKEGQTLEQIEAELHALGDKQYK